MDAGTYKVNLNPNFNNHLLIGSSKESAKEMADLTNFTIEFEYDIKEWKPYSAKGMTKRYVLITGCTIGVTSQNNESDPATCFAKTKIGKQGDNAYFYACVNAADGLKVELPAAIAQFKSMGGDGNELGKLEFDIKNHGVFEVSMPEGWDTALTTSTEE